MTRRLAIALVFLLGSALSVGGVLWTGISLRGSGESVQVQHLIPWILSAPSQVLMIMAIGRILR
jgi:hypothetical protein